MTGCSICRMAKIWDVHKLCRRHTGWRRKPSEPREPKHLAARPTHIDWYYTGKLFDAGRDSRGFDYEYDNQTGETKRITSASERVHIAAYGKRYGVRQAADKYDVRQVTVRSWMTQARKRRAQRSRGRAESTTHQAA
jgi:hypothetical protein